MITLAELKRRFTYHAPSAEKGRRHKAVNELMLATAVRITELTPPGRQLALALTDLERAKQSANAGIAQTDELYYDLPALEALDRVENALAGLPTRGMVYLAIDSERDYQDAKWNPSTTSSGGKHSVTEFLVFMRSYVNQALEEVSRNAEPSASESALHSVRKIAALAVVTMEQHGAPRREQ